MDCFIFSERNKQGRLDFHPGVVYGFEDADVVPFCEMMDYGNRTDKEPSVIITIDELDVDPCVVFGHGENQGRFVMPDRAAAHLGTSLEAAKAYKWQGEYQATKELVEAQSNG